MAELRSSIRRYSAIGGHGGTMAPPACRMARDVCLPRALLVAVGDAAAVEVVRRELDLDAVAGEDPDVVAAHLPRDVAQELLVVVELDPSHIAVEALRELT